MWLHTCPPPSHTHTQTHTHFAFFGRVAVFATAHSQAHLSCSTLSSSIPHSLRGFLTEPPGAACGRLLVEREVGSPHKCLSSQAQRLTEGSGEAVEKKASVGFDAGLARGGGGGGSRQGVRITTKQRAAKGAGQEEGRRQGVIICWVDDEAHWSRASGLKGGRSEAL